MKIKLLTRYANAKRVAQPGTVIELPDDEAKELVRTGHAEEVKADEVAVPEHPKGDAPAPVDGEPVASPVAAVDPKTDENPEGQSSVIADSKINKTETEQHGDTPTDPAPGANQDPGAEHGEGADSGKVETADSADGHGLRNAGKNRGR